MTILVTIATLLLCAPNPSPNQTEPIQLSSQNKSSEKETNSTKCQINIATLLSDHPKAAM
jgi:hypothetical protein